MVADQIKLPFSYLFQSLDYARVYDLRRIDRAETLAKVCASPFVSSRGRSRWKPQSLSGHGKRVMRCRWKCGRLLPKSNHLPWKPFVCLRRSSERLVLLSNRCSYRGAKGRFGTLARRRVQRVVIPCVRRAWRLSRAGVIQPLPGPADLRDYGKPRVSQLQSRCSRAAKYAPSKGRKLPQCNIAPDHYRRARQSLPTPSKTCQPL
jgi:hypothetical protein